MDQTLRILILEDNPADAELIQFELEEAGIAFTAKRVKTEKDYLHALFEFSPDIILSDYDLPLYNGAAALAEAKKRCPDVPFILVTGAVSEDRAIEILTEGAKDYVLKGRLEQRLVPAIRRALAEAEEHKERKKAQEEVRAASLYARSLIEASLDPLVTISPDGKVMDVNRATEEITGVSRDRIIGTDFTNYFTEPKKAQAGYKRAFSTGSIKDYPLAVRHISGRVAEVLFNATTYTDERGEIKGVFAAARDVTELRKAGEDLRKAHRDLEKIVKKRTAALEVEIEGRKKFEEALLESEHRVRERAMELEALLDAAPTPIFIAYDPDCLHLTGNRAANNLLKIPHGSETSLSAPDEVKPRHFRAFKDGRELTNEELPAQRAARGTPVRDFEFSLVFDDGATRHVLGYGTPLHDGKGRPRGAVHVLVDITERMQAEEALRQERDFSSIVLETAGALVVVLDRQGRITRFNRACEDLTGYSAAEVRGRIFWEFLVPPEDLAGVKTTWGMLAAGSFPNTHENHWVAKDGTQRLIVWSNSAIIKAGDVQYVIGTGIDITERKKAEEEAHQLLAAVSEEKKRLAALINSMQDEIWFADTQKRFTLVNRAALKEFRLGTGDGRNIETFTAGLEVYRPDGTVRPIDEAPPLRALQGEEVRNQEEIIRTPASGALRYRQVSASPVRDIGGGIIGSVSVVRDITDSKHIEEEARESGYRYRRLFNTLIEGFCIIEMLFDADGRPVDYRFLETNPAFEKQTGLHDVQGKRISDLVPDNEAYWFEIYGKVALTGEPARCENEVKALNRWFEVFAYRVGESESRKVAIMFNDITDRKKSEQALRAAEAKAKALINYAPTGIYEIDYRGRRFVNVNDAMCQILGYTREELSSMDPSVLLDEDSRALFMNRIRRQLAGEKIEEAVEYRVRKKDGRIIHALLNVSFDPEGSEAGRVLVVAHDITERKKAEDNLKRHTIKLEEINKELESFSYSVSHDLRAPLRAIDGYLRMILKRQGDQFDEETKRQFDQVKDSTRVMSQLIDDLLALSKLNRQDLDIKILDIRQLIEKAWQELQKTTPDRNMTLKMNSLPPGWGDQGLMKQVVINILSNAIKFTKGRDVALLETGGYGDGNEMVYYVKDNGVGFDMQYHDKLFGVFQRLHGADEYEGTGIGLSLVQRIIHRHGGRVWAEGKVNEGATFYFTLPGKG